MSRSRRVILALAVATILPLSSAPAPAAVAQGELSKARAQRRAVQVDLDRTVRAYDAAQTQLARTQESIKANRLALQEAEVASRTVRSRLAKRADIMYRRGPVLIFYYLIGATNLIDFAQRITFMERVSNQDARTLTKAASARSDLSRLQQQLEQKSLQEQKLLAEMSDQSKSLAAGFARAQALESRLVAEGENQQRLESQRQAGLAAEAAAKAKAEAEAKSKADQQKAGAARATPSPSPSPRASASPSPSPSPSPAPAQSAGVAVPTAGMRCPVAGPVSFTDTYGAPRPNERTHKGVDMFAAAGTPVAAVVDGAVLRMSTTGSGGIALYFKGDDGVEYYYAHLSSFADISPGQKMAAGGQLGSVGNSGNAAGSPPHLHFEVKPPSGSINPTPTARRACG